MVKTGGFCEQSAPKTQNYLSIGLNFEFLQLLAMRQIGIRVILLTRYRILVKVSSPDEIILGMENMFIKFSVLFLTPILLVLTAGVLLRARNQKENLFALCFLLLTIQTLSCPLYYTNIFWIIPVFMVTILPFRIFFCRFFTHEMEGMERETIQFFASGY